MYVEINSSEVNIRDYDNLIDSKATIPQLR